MIRVRVIFYPLLFVFFLSVFCWPTGCGKSGRDDIDKTDRVEQSSLKKLASLGYINLVPVAAEHDDKSGVTCYDQAFACEGVNLFNSRERSEAILMTMDGRPIHRWFSEEKGEMFKQFLEMLPGHSPPYVNGWNHVEMMTNGDLLAIGSHHLLLRLCWDSSVKWKLDLAAHHDLSIGGDGSIYVLADKIRTVDVGGEPVSFQDNAVVVVSPDGDILRELSLFDAFQTGRWKLALAKRLGMIKETRVERVKQYRRRIQSGMDEGVFLDLYEMAIEGNTGDYEGVMNLLFHNQSEDVFHANSIQVLDRDRPGLWRAGDLLLCSCHLDQIILVDHLTGLVSWTWGFRELDRPHHATLLDDGNILIFDNGTRRGYSRIIKFDPLERDIVWQYRADPVQSFFSDSRGGCEQLPNGNILIADTNTGRAFEITPGGHTVWEYFNEHLNREKDVTRRGAIYRMTRLNLDSVNRIQSTVICQNPAAGK